MNENNEIDIFDKLNDKWSKMPIGRKILAFILVGIMFVSLFVLLKYARTHTQTFTYPSGCKEQYINGVLNGSECTEDRQKIEDRYNNRWIYDVPLNFSFNGSLVD